MSRHAAQGWIEEMSAHLKSVDPNHLVTVGEEGFYAVGSVNERLNPGNGWASITGQNFSANHAPAGIDFAAIHLWPDNWEVRRLAPCLPACHGLRCLLPLRGRPPQLM